MNVNDKRPPQRWRQRKAQRAPRQVVRCALLPRAVLHVQRRGVLLLLLLMVPALRPVPECWARGAPAVAAAPAMRVILLGTGGGPTPKSERSAPAQAVVVGEAVYVIDCGDGVARQLVRAGLKLQQLRAVFVTHHHSDHNADLGNLLLLAWAQNLTHRVDIVAPPPVATMTRLFLELNAVDIAVRMQDEGRPPLQPLMVAHEVSAPGVVWQDERVTVTAALVSHPPLAPALAFRFDLPGRSVVFSGDTAPSDNLVRLAQGADVLVHEALYLPALEPLLKTEQHAAGLRQHLLASHTTTTQVGEIAARAGVKKVVLTHLVPGGLPQVPDAAWRRDVQQHFAGEVVVGRDLLQF